MSIAAQQLPPNAIPRFYRGGPRIAALRGFDATGDNTPEEWVGSSAATFGDPRLGPSPLTDGTLLRDAIAADPEPWLGAAHVARFGADPALLVKLLDAGERLPVHLHPDDAFAAEHLGSRFGKTEAWIVLEADPGAQVHVGFREDVAADTLRGWIDAQDGAALLGALNAVDVAAGGAIFVPAGVPHAIGAGILIAELQQPTDFSLMLEWDGFGIDGEREATLGLGWDIAVGCVDREALDPSALAGPGPGSLLPRAADPFFRAQALAGGGAELRAGFAVVLVTAGAGTIAGLDVARGDALVVPHAAGPIAAAGDVVAIACRPPEVAA